MKNSNLLENFSTSDCTISTLIAEEIIGINITLAEIPLKYENKIALDDENYQTKCENLMLKYLDLEDSDEFLIYNVLSSSKIITSFIEIFSSLPS